MLSLISLIKSIKKHQLKDPITSLFRMVGILVSLMLSLAFGEVINEWQAIRNAIDREAAAILDTYNYLKYFDSEDTIEIRAVLIDYVQAVIDDDWPALANDRLGQRTSALKMQFSDKIIELKPVNSIQEDLKSGLLADIDTMSDHRFIRLNHSMAKPTVYTLVIIFGFIVSMTCFGAYQPHIPLITLVSLYTFFIGMVFYLILAMSDPFQLSLRQDCRVFQDKSVIEIVQTILGEHPLSQSVEFRLQRNYPPLEFCAQFQECDFDFISRLLEQEGIFYFFEHSKR